MEEDFGRRNDFLIPIGVDISFVALAEQKQINRNYKMGYLHSILM